jgi:hypothetical protein
VCDGVHRAGVVAIGEGELDSARSIEEHERSGDAQPMADMVDCTNFSKVLS